MKKAIIYSVAVAFLCVAGFAGMSMAADDKGPAEITLKTAEGKKPAVFPHAKHQEKQECDLCHKAASYTPGAWTKETGHAQCQTCHKENENKELAKCKTCHPGADK
ncbi:MAG TPA: cytochrome C [Desulfobulbaceae bacterium]|nr:cytochrome C [Desulfobulbaceae bacterium]